MRRKLFLLSTLFFFFHASLQSAASSMGYFSQKQESSSLVIHWNGQPLIGSDFLNLPGYPAGNEKTDEAGQDSVSILSGGTPGDALFYREVHTKDRDAEITWFIKSPEGLKTPLFYELRFPLEALAGSSYQATTAISAKAVTKPKTVQGRIGEALPEGRPLAEGIVHVTFQWPDGRALTIDLNPKGPHAALPFLGLEEWQMFPRGGEMVLRTPFRRADDRWGSVRQFKIRLKSDALPYETFHNSNRNTYVNLEPSLQLAFGTGRLMPGFQRGGVDGYSPETGIGWLDNQGLELVMTDFDQGRQNFRAGHVKPSGSGEKVYRIDGRDGLYLLTLAFGSADHAGEGPFSVAVNGTTQFPVLETAPGRFMTKTVPAWMKNGRLTFALAGTGWMLNALSLTPLVFDDADYLWKRSWWIHPGRFKTWLAENLPTPVLKDFAFEEKSDDPTAWLWNASFETLEGTLRSSRLGLDTREAVAKRLDTIVSGGFRGVIINGQHFRFAKRTSAVGALLEPHLLRNTRLAVEEAHRRRLKVIAHFDINFVYYDGYPEMLRILQSDRDALARSVGNSLRVQANFCLNSRGFLKFTKDYLSQHLRAAGVDGYMIDEMTFYGKDYCGCDTCRDLFYKETGLRIPFENEGGRFLGNPGDHLWRKFTHWRGLKVAAFVQRLKDELRTINPNLLWMRYDAPPLTQPGRISLALNDVYPWNCDHVGDEFHPNDMLLNWRSSFARFKTRQGAVSSWVNRPTWQLAKVDGDPTQILLAWSLARMHRGNLWRRSVDDALSRKLNTWQGQMRDATARPLSDVAVLLSPSTVDFAADTSVYHDEYTAWLQTLAQENIQYDVILERDLKRALEKSDYRVLVLPNTVMLDEAQAGIIDAFANKGGRVIVVDESGRYAPSGQQRKQSILAGPMNLRWKQALSGKRHLVLTQNMAGGMAGRRLEVAGPVWEIAVADDARSEILARYEEEATPAMIKTIRGDGFYYYLSGRFLSRNYEPRMATEGLNRTISRHGTLYPTDFDPQLNQLVGCLLADALGDKAKTRAVNLPKGVIYTAFRQNAPGREGVVLHLLNLQSRRQLKAGEPMVLQSPVAFPAVKQPLVFHVHSPKRLETGHVAGPLQAASFPVEIKTTDREDGYEVTVPAEALRDYSVVHLFESSPE